MVRDLITYIDHLKDQNCISNPDNYFDKVKVTNFDMIHSSCRGDQLKKSIKEHFKKVILITI